MGIPIGNFNIFYFFEGLSAEDKHATTALRLLFGPHVIRKWEREINHWVRGNPPEFFATGIDKLLGRWEGCGKLEGKYIERFDDKFILFRVVYLE